MDQITITFTGSRPCVTGNCEGNSKGIFVNPDGPLSLYGRKGTAKPEQSWTHLMWREPPQRPMKSSVTLPGSRRARPL